MEYEKVTETIIGCAYRVHPASPGATRSYILI